MSVALLPDPVSVEQALIRSGTNIEVPAGQTRICGPFDDFSDVYRIANVVHFEELQQLRLVPEGLTEQVAFEAMRADEEDYRRERLQFASASGNCTCDGGRAQGFSALNRRPRRRYANLISAMNDASRSIASRTYVAFDDTNVMHTASTLRRWYSRRGDVATLRHSHVFFLVGTAFPESISIEENGVLVMSPSVWVLSTGQIDMAAGSRLRFENGSVTANCETLNGPGSRLFVIPWATEVPEVVWGWTAHPVSSEMSLEEVAREQRIGRFLPGYSRERDWSREESAA